MKPHKWAKEIKAWADGAEIQCRKKTGYGCIALDWRDIGQQESIDWSMDEFEFRIKPQPKEPQYLYAWENQSTGEFRLGENEPNPLREYVSQWKCIGKIKLEQDE